MEQRFEPAFDEILLLGSVGDDEGAIAVADSVTEATTDQRIVGRALMLKVGFLYNLGRIDECPLVLDRAFGVLDGRSEHGVLGGLHAMAGLVAAPTSMGRCLWHLVQGVRELEQESQPGREAVDAWHNVAVALSYAGYHCQAVEMAERAYQLGQRLGLSASDHALPEVSVRRAVAADHVGDSARCVRFLRDALVTWSGRTDPDRIWRVERCYYAYAGVRLAAMGEQVERMPGVFDVSGVFDVEVEGWEVRDLRLLSGACIAVSRQRPDDALTQLDGRQVDPHTLGAAEVFRVRALAHSAAGDYRAAAEADREAVRLASATSDDLRELLVLGVQAKLDGETLRRSVELHASEALTDPLTGLPNRRHFDRRVTEEGRNVTVLGVIDLDDFKTVNTVHGHAGGDLVLQRVAAVLARTVRDGDFVCRFGGDEFVVALSDTDLATAEDIGDRITRAVAGEDWNALVVGTPVSVTIGWAEVGSGRSLTDGIDLADNIMLAGKHNVTGPRPSM